MPHLKNNIGIYQNNGRPNCVNFAMSLEAYEAMGEPKEVVFSESTLSLHTSTINTTQCYLVHVNKKRAIITVRLLYTEAETLYGSWDYTVGDLSLSLLTKQS